MKNRADVVGMRVSTTTLAIGMDSHMQPSPPLPSVGKTPVGERTGERDASGLRTVAALLITIALVIALVVGPVVANSQGRGAGTILAWATGTLWVASILGFTLTGWVQSERLGKSRAFVGTTIVSLVLFGGVFLPGASLVWRTRSANVERLLGTTIATDEKLTFAFLLASAVAGAFFAGEAVAIWLTRHRARRDGYDWRRAHVLLYAVGFVGTAPALITRNISDSFAERGTESGAGVLVLASWCLPLAAAIAVSQRHWGSRLRLATTGIAVTMLLASGVRSPLLLIAIAALPRLVSAIAASRFSLGRWLALGAGAYGLFIVAAAISSWRGGIRAGRTSDLLAELLRHALNPGTALTSSGIDTLDGLLLVQSVDTRQFDPSMFDLLKVFTTFIPRQLYPDKPPLLSNMISQSVLDFGAAGMFLSGPGYLLVISGSVAAVIALFALGGLTFGLIGSVTSAVGGAVLGYTLLRFVMGGDAFDFYQGLTLVLLLVCARLVAAVGGAVGRHLTGTGAAGTRRPALRTTT